MRKTIWTILSSRDSAADQGACANASARSQNAACYCERRCPDFEFLSLGMTADFPGIAASGRDDARRG